MPVHDWSKVEAGIFHAFHHGWIEELSRALNDGLLPKTYYALAEQITGEIGPDVVTLSGPPETPDDARGGIALALHPPKVQLHARSEARLYAARAKAVAIHHITSHRVVAIIEIVSPGNKSSVSAFNSFIRKAREAIRSGIHLLVIDLFSPTARNPEGIHAAIWDEIGDAALESADSAKPLTAAAYLAGPAPEAFVEFFALGDYLPDMPLFLTPETYISVPLEATYQSKWKTMPAFWRDVLDGARQSQ